MEPFTLIGMQEATMNMNMSESIDYAKSFYIPYPAKPTSPRLLHHNDLKEVKEHAEKLEEYEKQMTIFNTDLEAYRVRSSEIESVIEEYIKNEAGFNELPEKAKEKVWRKAWADGHSSGYYAVYQELEELVDLFM